MAKEKRTPYDKWRTVVLSVGFLTNILVASALAQSSDYIYWTEATKVRRANLDGTGAQDLVTGVSAGHGIALDLPNNRMYWMENTAGKIRRANIDGSDSQDHITGVAQGIDLYGRYLSAYAVSGDPDGSRALEPGQ